MDSTVSILSNPFETIKDFIFHQTEAEGQQGSTIPVVTLKGSRLQASLSSAAGSWKNRCDFISALFQHISSSCRKTEPVTIISMGSSQLLMEFLLLTLLMKNGVKEIYFIGIDPTYRSLFQNELTEFRERISQMYLALWHEEMPKKRIKYLTSANNVSKYFSPSSAVVMQCLPPYGEILADCKKMGIQNKDPLTLFADNATGVKEENANAIMLIPPILAKDICALPPQSTISLSIFRNKGASENYCMDWGVKISPTGELTIDFSHSEKYIESISASGKADPTQLSTLKEVFLQLPAKLQEALQTELKSLQKPLSKEQVLVLLKKAKEIAANIAPFLTCLLLEDYELRFQELMEYLKTNAPRTHVFTLVMGPSNESPIKSFELLGEKPGST